jgi:hypothetical protein
MTDKPEETEPIRRSGKPVVASVLLATIMGAAVGIVLFTIVCGLYFDYRHPDSNLAGFVAIVYGFEYGAPLGALIGACIGLFFVAHNSSR